ncbi:MAG TPA: hypothetical protein PKM28_10480, partial [Tenuifilaceae bacterium]|nr:hypothetical protein [Tenuifilaceae bacterium]
SSLLQFSYSQPMLHSEEIADANFCRIERYVTDIRRVDEDAKEISVNILFYVDISDGQSVFELNVPSAEKLKITNYTVRVYDSEGSLIQKEKVKKPSISEFSKFNPRFFASKYTERGSTLKVELDYKLLVVKPKGFYEWPAVSIISSPIGQTSLRLNFEESNDFEFNSNMEAEQEKDINTGGFYYLWIIKKLTSNGGEFNGANVTAPVVKISLK